MKKKNVKKNKKVKIGLIIVISIIIGVFLMKTLSVMGDLTEVSDIIGHKYFTLNSKQKKLCSDEKVKNVKKDIKSGN